MRKSNLYKITKNEIKFVIEPHIDSWQKNLLSLVLQMETDEKYFSFVVKIVIRDLINVVSLKSKRR